MLGAWGVFNLAATVMLLAHRIPSRRLQVATIVLDLAVSSGLVYLTGGYNSDLAVTFFIVVIASSLRFGLVGSMACAFVAGVAYFVVGFNVASQHLDTRPDRCAGVATLPPLRRRAEQQPARSRAGRRA